MAIRSKDLTGIAKMYLSRIEKGVPGIRIPLILSVDQNFGTSWIDIM